MSGVKIILTVEEFMRLVLKSLNVQITDIFEG